MVRAKGKANASTKRSVSKGADADTSNTAALTNDSSEIENVLETGDSVETAVETTVTEQTTVTVAEEDEIEGADPEGLKDGEQTVEEDDDEAETDALDGEDAIEENDGGEPEDLDGEDDTMEENDAAKPETPNDEHATEEDEGNEVVGEGDEKRDVISNGEGNYQETAMEQEGSKQITNDNLIGAATGIDKDNQQDLVEKNEDETNVEKVEGSVKPKNKRLRKRNNKKRKVNDISEEEGKNKQVVKKVATNGNAGNDKVDTEQSAKKVASVDKSKVAPKDKPEPSSKKSKKKAKGMGMIFMCNSETKKDCYRHKVLGLPASKKEMVDKIYKGMRLFLYDVDLKLMYGIYKASTPGGYNLVPKAFKKQFPAQVRFSILEDCLPLAEEVFRQAIKKNYYSKTKFDCQLSPEQVKDLCKLFTAAGKGSRSKDTRTPVTPRTPVMPRTPVTPVTPVTSKRDTAKRKRGRGERKRPERPSRRSGRVEEPRRYRGRVEGPRVYPERVEDPRRYRERVEERVYHEHRPLVALAPVQPLPPPAPVQSYAYTRTLAADPYRRDDSYRQPRLVELPDPYRRDPLADAYRRQAVLEPHDYYRRDVLPERREYDRPLTTVAINDPYVSYRERLAQQDPVVRTQPEYNPPTGLRAEYRHGGLLSSEYSTSGSRLLEYPSAGTSSLYDYPRYRY